MLFRPFASASRYRGTVGFSWTSLVQIACSSENSAMASANLPIRIRINPWFVWLLAIGLEIG